MRMIPWPRGRCCSSPWRPVNDTAMADELAQNLAHECVGAIVTRDDSILLGKRTAERDFYPHVWDVFGGHVEPHESRQQTLRRELQEELGIEPTAWQYLETLSGADATGRIECHLFVVNEWCGTPKNHQPEEHSEIRWFRLEDVQQVDLAHPEYLRIFRQAVSRQQRLEGQEEQLP